MMHPCHRLLALAWVWVALAVAQPSANSYDVVVVGATPSGIFAALEAARHGHQVALTERTTRIGGLLTGGLSYTDFRTTASLTGPFLQYLKRVESHYRTTYGEGSQQLRDCFGGAHAEPKVSLAILQQMVAEEKNLRLLPGHELVSTETKPAAAKSAANEQAASKLLRSATFLTANGKVTLRGKQFIDATYEGDLAAAAGVAFRLGRESTREFGERFAGVIFTRNGVILPGSTGEGDRRIQGYNFRPIMTQVAENRIMVTKPAGYRPERYARVLDYVRNGRLTAFFTEGRDGVLRVQRLPNGKADINDIKFAPVRLSQLGENYDWPEANWARRERIAADHREFTLGLIYFLQNDPRLPEKMRQEASQWGLAADEFPETGHFPPALYIREARRIVGQRTFTEHDVMMTDGLIRAPLHADAVAIGDYALNCHGVRPPGPLYPDLSEGDYNFLGQPFQIPYGVLVPKGFANLHVSVAVSASHVGFSALRLEPVWSALGVAAGAAAHLQLINGRVNISQLQALLHERGQATMYFSDVAPGSPDFALVQRAGLKGLFHYLVQWPETSYAPQKLVYGLQYAEPPAGHDAGLNRPVDRGFIAQWAQMMGRRPSTLSAADGKLTRRDILQELERLGSAGNTTPKP